MATKHTRTSIRVALDTYLREHTQLTNRSWKAVTGIGGGTVTLHLGSTMSFTALLCIYAAEHAPVDRVYAWGQCPAGKRHQPGEYFTGTPAEWKAGGCPVCERQTARREDWLASLPTFAQVHPDLVSHLDNPDDANTRGQVVAFVCSDCGARPLSWSPTKPGPPVCGWCRARDGRDPGDLAPRTGGGTPVRLEVDLATEIGNLGEEVRTDVGVVTNRGSYHVPVIKPDLVLPAHRVVVEVDHAGSSRTGDRHDTDEGVLDDQHRDRLLAALGWRVLRIRRPGQPVDGSWPWRVETNSTNPRSLARLVIEQLT